MARPKKNPWAQLDAEWYLDPEIEGAADAEPVALWLWPVLIGMAKSAGDEDANPEGVITTTAKKLRGILRLTLKRADARVINALDVLVVAERLTYTASPLGILRITLGAYRKWQINAPQNRTTAGNQKTTAGNGRTMAGQPPAMAGQPAATEGDFAGTLVQNGTEPPRVRERAIDYETRDKRLEITTPNPVAVDVQEEAEFVELATKLMTNKATPIGVARQNAELLLRKANKAYMVDGRSLGRFPLSQWAATIPPAMEYMAKKAAEGKPVKSLVALVHTMVPETGIPDVIAEVALSPEDQRAAAAEERQAKIRAEWAAETGVSA